MEAAPAHRAATLAGDRGDSARPHQAVPRLLLRCGPGVSQKPAYATALRSPRRLNSVSSTATVTAAPSGSSVLTIRCASTIPRIAAFHGDREKNPCARSCDQVLARPAPVSIPVTVPLPVCATSPVTSAVKVANVGVVKTRRFSNTASRTQVRSGPEALADPLPGGGVGTADASSPLGPSAANHTKPPHQATLTPLPERQKLESDVGGWGADRRPGRLMAMSWGMRSPGSGFWVPVSVGESGVVAGLE